MLAAQRESQFRDTLDTLAALSDCFTTVSTGGRIFEQRDPAAWGKRCDVKSPSYKPSKLLNLLAAFEEVLHGARQSIASTANGRRIHRRKDDWPINNIHDTAAGVLLLCRDVAVEWRTTRL